MVQTLEGGKTLEGGATLEGGQTLDGGKRKRCRKGFHKHRSENRCVRNASPKRRRSRSPGRRLSPGEHLSQDAFFKKIRALEKKGDTTSMKLREQMLLNILKKPSKSAS